MRRTVMGGAVLIGLLLLLGPSAPAFGRTPVVAPGGRFQVAADGFAPRAQISLRLAGSRDGRQAATADPQGRVRATYIVPARPGDYRLLLVGAPAGPVAPVRPVPATGPGDAQVIAVSVPRLVALPFRVTKPAGGLGVAGVSVGPRGSGGPNGAGGAAVGGLAATGPDLAMMIGYGVVLLVAGVTTLGAGTRGRSRRRAAVR